MLVKDLVVCGFIQWFLWLVYCLSFSPDFDIITPLVIDNGRWIEPLKHAITSHWSRLMFNGNIIAMNSNGRLLVFASTPCFSIMYISITKLSSALVSNRAFQWPLFTCSAVGCQTLGNCAININCSLMINYSGGGWGGNEMTYMLINARTSPSCYRRSCHLY